MAANDNTIRAPFTRDDEPTQASVAMRLKLDRVEWFALALAVVVALAFGAHEWLFPSYYDAFAYEVMGREIAEHGVFHKFADSDLRTYGYPFFLSLVLRLAIALHLQSRVVLFVVQLVLYLAACVHFRGVLARVFPTAAPVAFCGLLVNYYVLIYLSISLTESLSLTLAIFAVTCWLEAYRKSGDLRPLIAGSLAVGFAVMVRPANLYLVAAWAVGFIVIARRARPAGARVFLSAACVAVAVALPWWPQAANNYRHYGKGTPLLVRDLGQLQHLLGIRNIKYATALPPVPVASIVYANPFASDTDIGESPWRWYTTHPWRGVVTLALHTFNMTDQDLLFTYSRDLDPWYRLPLGVINHAVVAMGLAGLVLLGRRALSRRAPAQVDAYAMLLVLMGANWALHAPTQIEMRFGLVLLLTLFPLAIYAAMRLLATGSARMMAAAGAGVAIYVVLALVLSGWVREQSPSIREAGRTAAVDPAALVTTRPGAR